MGLTSTPKVPYLLADVRGQAAGRRWMTLSRESLLAFICVSVLVHASAVAPPTLTAREIDDGYVWLTVGDPGNRAFGGLEGGPVLMLTWIQFAGRGSVPYRYRITQTEVLVWQYLEFVEAYWPFFDGDPLSIDLTGDFIIGARQGNGYIYEIIAGWEDAPSNMSLRNAARFCNWLHNGKVSERWAFEKGVYDASTFTRNPDGSYNDDYSRSPNARYWIPSLDEWLKAVYYDPDRFGAGQGGWWRFPAAADEPLLVALPSKGGETNGSLWNWYNNPLLPAGMYPDIQSPWGLLDASGGFAELTEDGYGMGSSFFDNDPEMVWSNDLAGNFSSDARRFPHRVAGSGLRLAKPARSSPCINRATQ